MITVKLNEAEFIDKIADILVDAPIGFDFEDGLKQALSEIDDIPDFIEWEDGFTKKINEMVAHKHDGHVSYADQRVRDIARGMPRSEFIEYLRSFKKDGSEAWTDLA